MNEWQPPTEPPRTPIFAGTPKDWKELQALVALLFSGMGCAAEVEKSVETARGTVELDVFVTDTASGHRITYVCECKLWTKAVSQHVVHGFRTVVADIGADIGIIISANGFQRGAIAAAELTNIRLLPWEEFQKTFEDRWTAAKIREVNGHLGRVVACTKKMPGFPNATLKRREYIKDLIQVEDEAFPITADWYIAQDAFRKWPPAGTPPIATPFGDYPSRHEFFEAKLRSMTGLAERAEALVEKWTEHSFTDSELLGGPTSLSFEEAARSLHMPEHVFGAVVLDLFHTDGDSYFDEREREYGLKDLIRIVRAVPPWLRG